MKRILMLVVVALVMAAMVVAMAMPAFAAPNCEGHGPPHLSGQHRAHSNANDKFNATGDLKYLDQNDKHYEKELDCQAEEPPGEGQ